MAGTKRGAEDGPASATRASKVAKTDKSSPTSKAKKGGAKKGAKAPPTSAFKSKALPLHVNLTHTPPSLSDGGHRSYGWTGTKRLTIELLNAEGGDKEKVNVMLTINATVMGE
ncbi:MI domain-containing protein [Mycena venus]|uniref:MI domain-containing protein n=1 Tax=Mycena venus TaxID=2733690 RepID=A0A8H6WRG6_9AGAR|nr:MI domain-containing protein [Mycena venus]